MKDSILDRRSFLRRAALLGAGVCSSSALLAACEGRSRTTAAPAARASCDDLSGLSAQQLDTRRSLKYVDKTPKPGQVCANCMLFKAQGACNGCTVVPGPIDAEGWCTAWAKRA